MKSRGNARYFWGAFTVTLCLIGLFCGLASAEYYTRQIGFGDDTPIACLARETDGELVLQIDILGAQASWDLSGVVGAVQQMEELWNRVSHRGAAGVE